MGTNPIRVLLAVCLSAIVAAPAGATKYAAEFLKIPVGARAVGMRAILVRERHPAATVQCDTLDEVPRIVGAP